VFVVQVRAGPRRGTQRHKIGEYGPFTVEQARERAEAIVRAVRDGRNPRQEKVDANAFRALTVSDLCDKYMEAARAGLVKTRFGRAKRSSTITFDQGRIDRHIKPILGKLAAQEVTARDVQAMVDEIALGKTAGVFKGKPRGKAVVTGGAGTAARIAGLLGGIYTWAKRRGLVDGPNPAHGIEKIATNSRDRVLSPDDLKRLGVALVDAEALHPAAAKVIRLIAATGLRRSEATSLRWSEVDEASQCLRLEGTKTGRSNRPISRLAMEIVRTQKGKSEKLVFPARNDKAGAHLKKQIAGIFDRAELHDARSHDLRRTFATVAADEGYSDATIGELLGHARRGVTARHYIRRPDAALVAAADRVSARIADALNGRARAEVASLRTDTGAV
jgi:integrase